jgi:GntR family transcriptional regulator
MFAYKKVKFAITQALGQKKWSHNQAIPSEPILASRYKVSVGTIRRAINELVAENILVREQGRGTFVVSHTEDYMLNVFFRIENKNGKRGLPNSNLISFAISKPTKSVASHLKLLPNEKIYKIKTILSFDQRPAIIDHIYLPKKIFSGLDETCFSNRKGTLFKLFQERYGITISKTEETVEAQLLTPEIATLLNQKPNLPVMKITRVAYAYKNTPIDLRIRYVDSLHYRYFNTLGGS